MMGAMQALVVMLSACLNQGADGLAPPTIHQPADFNGAVGAFRIQAHAEPVTLKVGESLAFTVRIDAREPAQVAPRRPDLQRLDLFTRLFYIEDLPAPLQNSGRTGPWEFAYGLTPRPGAHVEEIPALPFVYYKPNLPPDLAYQTIRTEPIPLTVRPRTQAAVVSVQPVRPDAAYHLDSAPGILSHDQAARMPPGWALALGLLLPPLLCVAWYLAWRHRHPDAVRARRVQQSGAARRALHRLASSVNGEPVLVVTGYLQQRLGLTVAEPTPAEVAGHLCKAGVSSALADKTAGFYRDWDRLRFGPADGDGHQSLGRLAAELILAIEEAEQRGPQS